MTDSVVPVLLYHAIGGERTPWIAPFTVTEADFRRHLESIAGSGRTAMTVAEFGRCLVGDSVLPRRPVIVTFDDGFVEMADVAAPLLESWGIPATMFLTTGFLDGFSPGGDRMLSWSAAAELVDAGIEVGAHSVSHPQLDTLTMASARGEITDCRSELEDRLDITVRSFAYPHGYSSRSVRALAQSAGYECACGVKNAFSTSDDATYSIARLTVTADTTVGRIEQWLRGLDASVAPAKEQWTTRLWRTYRRTRALPGRMRETHVRGMGAR